MGPIDTCRSGETCGGEFVHARGSYPNSWPQAADQMPPSDWVAGWRTRVRTTVLLGRVGPELGCGGKGSTGRF